MATYGHYNYYTKSFIITLFKMQSNIKENGNNEQCQMTIRNKAALSYYTENLNKLHRHILHVSTNMLHVQVI